MSNKIIITADSSCDLNEELIKKYSIFTIPIHVNYDNASYLDGVDIKPIDIINKFEQTGKLPKTAAVSVGEYKDFFKRFTDQGYEIIHINLGSGFSSTHQNAVIASRDFENVYPVDSCHLSTGTGFVAIEAALLAEKGMSSEEIVEKVKEIIPKIRGSFILDKLNFLAAGGRCSSVVALGANLLNLKPCIEESSEKSGSMEVGKKFRGKYEKTVIEYLDHKFSQYDSIKGDKVYFTHAGVDEELVKKAVAHIKSKNLFDEIYVNTASCTVCSHCGQNTLGMFFIA